MRADRRQSEGTRDVAELLACGMARVGDAAASLKTRRQGRLAVLGLAMGRPPARQ